MLAPHSRFVGHEQGARLLAAGALAAAWMVLAWQWLSGTVTIPWDAKAQFLPQLQFLAASFAKGESPFWTPNVFSGHPQIADPQSLIFSPPYVLLALFNSAPTAWAADTTIYLMLLASAIALMLWLADKGLHPAAAVMAALSFAFGAAMAWRIQHVGQVMSLAYLPVVLLFLDRALTRRSVANSALAGLAAALLVLGRDQIALLSVYFLIAYVVSGWWTAPDRAASVRTSIKPLAAAAFVGSLVIAIPVILTALVAADSNRPSIDFEGAGHGSLHPALLLTAFAPDVFGSSGHYGEYWGPPSGIWKDTQLYLAQNMGQLYIGALPILMLIRGLATGVIWRREVRIFTIALGVSIVYALGWYTPVFKFMHAYMPGVDLYRRPADAVFVIGFFASVLAGYSFHAVLTEHRERLSPQQVLVYATMPCIAFALMIGLAVYFKTIERAWPAIATAAGLMAAALIALWLVRAWGLGPPAATALIAVLMTADLGFSNGPGNATGLPPVAYEVLDPATKNSTIAKLKELVASNTSDNRRDRVELVGFGFHWPNASLTHGLENTLGYNPLRLGLYTRATGAGDQVGLPSQKGFSPLWPSYRSRLSDLLGLRYIATSVPIDGIDTGLKPGDLTLLAKTDDGYIYENSRALPRVLFATQSLRADFSSLLQTGAWPEFDPATAVLLEDAATGKAGGLGSARISAYHNTNIAIEAESQDGGFVVLNDIWQPWWFATLDGEDAPLLRANVLFRAVKVPPGHHTIRFSFEPLRGAFAQLKSRAPK